MQSYNYSWNVFNTVGGRESPQRTRPKNFKIGLSEISMSAS